MQRAFVLLLAALLAGAAPAAAALREVRGTWLTTTANDALRTPRDTADAMRRLKHIGINTVYVEAWKNGYAQFPSQVLARALGGQADPAQAPRNLLQESLIEAHRNGLIYVAWFEYGFMAAHKDTMNELRRQKPAWLSRDIHGSEVAPNGFVWLNPLHPEARGLLLDLVLEAVDRYDIDGIQLDDRIVWPHVAMGYDDYTQQVFASEHGGRRPPADHTDPAWMAWRAAKVESFARTFTVELRKRKPRLLVSLSPAVYPWSWEHYLMAWPKWRGWDEAIPQVYRFSFDAFEKTWREQLAAVRKHGDGRMPLVAGIRIVGDGPDSSWDQLRRSIELARATGGAGHVLWFSRGVLDKYDEQLAALYAESGPASSPHFDAGWRVKSMALVQHGPARGAGAMWRVPPRARGVYQLIGHDGYRWSYLGMTARGQGRVSLPARYRAVELLVDRRIGMSAPR